MPKIVQLIRKYFGFFFSVDSNGVDVCAYVKDKCGYILKIGIDFSNKKKDFYLGKTIIRYNIDKKKVQSVNIIDLLKKYNLLSTFDSLLLPQICYS